MCEWDCKHALCHLRMVRIPFTTNQNLLVFAWTQREVGAPCWLQVSGKLVYHVPSANCLVRMHQPLGRSFAGPPQTFFLKKGKFSYIIRKVPPKMFSRFSGNIFKICSKFQVYSPEHGPTGDGTIIMQIWAERTLVVTSTFSPFWRRVFMIPTWPYLAAVWILRAPPCK